jgi:hypothetical protein
MESYKRLEDCLNQYANQVKTNTTKEHLYDDDPIYLSTDDENFPFWNQDIVRQLISGLGFRITAARMDDLRVPMIWDTLEKQ